MEGKGKRNVKEGKGQEDKTMKTKNENMCKW
jgi:hypothetical protein